MADTSPRPKVHVIVEIEDGMFPRVIPQAITAFADVAKTVYKTYELVYERPQADLVYKDATSEDGVRTHIFRQIAPIDNVPQVEYYATEVEVF